MASNLMSPYTNREQEGGGGRCKEKHKKEKESMQIRGYI